MDYDQLFQSALPRLIDGGIMVFKAIAVWIIGRWLIGFAMNLIMKSMTRQKIDPTVIGYATSTLRMILNVVLVVALLSFFGIETTTFAALLAGLGLAIGAAWGGLLANFASGALLVFLKPFRTGDFVTAGAMTGTVEEIGMFVTTINTPDNVRTFVGNNKIFSETIQNFSSNSYRRVDITAPVAHSVNIKEAMAQITASVGKIQNVVGLPEPDIKILGYNASGCVLAIRPYCHTDNYWQVYFDTHEVVKSVLGDGGFSAPVVRPEIP